MGRGVLIPHHQRIRRLVDVQAAVYRGLHVAACRAVIGHGTVLHAVPVGLLGLHVLILVVQLAAFGVDGGDQVCLALVLETAQPVVDGARHHVIRAVHAVLHATAPQHVLQRAGVVVQIKAPVLCFQLLDQRCIAHFQPILRLGFAKFAAVGAVTQCCPCGAEVRAVARLTAAAGIRAVCLIQLRRKVQVDVIRLLIPQPRAEAVQRSGIAGEHI